MLFMNPVAILTLTLAAIFSADGGPPMNVQNDFLLIEGVNFDLKFTEKEAREVLGLLKNVSFIGKVFWIKKMNNGNIEIMTDEGNDAADKKVPNAAAFTGGGQVVEAKCENGSILILQISRWES